MRVIRIVAAAALMGIGALLTTQSASTYEGSSDYQAFCSSCHGPSGRGDGVMAEALQRRPTDLTQLARNNRGVFPAEKVFQAIEGGASAHGGSPDMPEWASVFGKSFESATASRTKDRIELLVKFLKTIQETQGAEHTP
jgi:hypothetical protein